VTHDIRLAYIEAPHAERLSAMTFPVYRHLLSMTVQPRHPEQGDASLVQPIAIGAWSGQAAMGMVLGALPIDTPAHRQRFPEVLSVYTRPDARRRGIATALLAALEEALRRDGFDKVTAVYMTGKPSVEAVERLLARQDWSAPVTRTVTVRFTVEQALATPWIDKAKFPPGKFEIFPWAELPQEDREEIYRSNQEARWISPGLEPWTYDHYGFDTVSSLGLRYKGEVVGWMINHRLSPDTVRITCAFMGRGLGRRARLVPLISASIERLWGTECSNCTFVTPVRFKAMVQFIRRRCVPWAGFVGESRGSEKRLTDSNTVVESERRPSKHAERDSQDEV